MIGCPHCGTLNRRGSKYCSNCGQRLDTIPGISCPSCNGPNSLGSTLCEFCGASLLPPAEEDDTGAQPSVPSPAAPAVSEREGLEPVMPARSALPSWLYPQPAEVPEEPELSAGVPSPIPAEPPAEQEANKYLRGIRGVLPSADVWLSSSMSRGKRGPEPGGNGTHPGVE